MLQSETAPIPEQAPTNAREAWMQRHRIYVWDVAAQYRRKTPLFHAARTDPKYPECYLSPVGMGRTAEGALRGLARRLKMKLPPAK